MTTMAGYVALLHRLTGQEDLTVAVPISNRNQTATEHIVGTFVNNLVIRNDLSGAPSLRELLQRVQMQRSTLTHTRMPPTRRW